MSLSFVVCPRVVAAQTASCVISSRVHQIWDMHGRSDKADSLQTHTVGRSTSLRAGHVFCEARCQFTWKTRAFRIFLPA